MRRRPSARDPLYEEPEYVAILGRVAANVRRLREAKGWTQEEAAHQCRELAVLVYASIERAENNFTAVTLARLAKGFGVDARELLEPAPAPPPRPPGRPRKYPAKVPDKTPREEASPKATDAQSEAASSEPDGAHST